MERTDKRVVLGIVVLVAGLFFAAGFALTMRVDEPESWTPAAEGLLAVPTPCCTAASLWRSLDVVTADEQRPRPASSAEAEQWLNAWPYRERDERETGAEEPLRVAAQNTEVRCVGAATGPEILVTGNDQRTLAAIRYRRECVYTKWKIWSEETAREHLNERHTVWVDEDGFFHGRVDYWR